MYLPWSGVQVYPENVECKDGKRMKGCQTNERVRVNPLSRMESHHYRLYKRNSGNNVMELLDGG